MKTSSKYLTLAKSFIATRKQKLSIDAIGIGKQYEPWLLGN
jgi:hypothetical protein